MCAACRRRATAAAACLRAACLRAAPRRLKAAKKRGLIAYSAPILLKGSHDKVPITLLVPAEGGEEAH